MRGGDGGLLSRLGGGKPERARFEDAVRRAHFPLRDDDAVLGEQTRAGGGVGEVDLNQPGEVLQEEAVVLELRQAPHDVPRLAGGAEQTRERGQLAKRAIVFTALEGGSQEHPVSRDPLL